MLQVRLGKRHEAQQEIIVHPARFKVLACGRRFGKTATAIDVLCRMLLDGKSAAYFAPTFRMGNEVWRELREILHPVIAHARESDWRLELYTGGVFEGWSLAQGAGEMVRGRKYHYVVMDEAALFDSADVWHGAIRPLLTDYAGGALFCSTPKGRNWFWQLFQQGQNPDMADWQSWQFPTRANPFIRAEEVDAAKQGMPERFFRQEYEAVFLDDGGVVFRDVDRVCSGNPQAWTAGESYYFGVDWGKDNDYTCVSVMNQLGRQVWLERFNKIGWAIQRGRLADLYERYRPSVILAEENSIGSVNIEALQAEGLPIQGFMTTGKSKGALIDTLALAMETSEVILLDDAVLKHELMAYEMTRQSHGWSYRAPSGGHDDTVMATALSLWASQRYGRVYIDFV